MYEYELMNVNTKERMFIWAYGNADMWNRFFAKSLDATEWDILHCDYID